MRFTVFSLSFLGLATASPVSTGDEFHKTYSLGFRLAVKPNNTIFDKMYVRGFHDGPGVDLVDVNARNQSRIFYQNGTLDQYEAGQSTIISDSGSPLFPTGLTLVNDGSSTHLSTVYLIGGPGTPGISVQQAAVLLPGDYLICDEPISYYQGEHHNILKHLSGPAEIPEECTAVCLIAECAQLNTVPKGSISNHDNALLTECYIDAKYA